MNPRRARLEQLIANARMHADETRETLHVILRTINALERVARIGTDEDITRLVQAVDRSAPEIVPS